MRVSPFRNLRLFGYLLLPEAFRSLSRLSSALSAKASALCPYCLTFRFHHPSVGDGGLLILSLITLFITDKSMSSYLTFYVCIKDI